MDLNKILHENIMLYPMESRVSIKKLDKAYLCEYRERITNKDAREKTYAIMQGAMQGNKDLTLVLEGENIGFDLIAEDTRAFLFAVIVEYLHQLIGQVENNKEEKDWLVENIIASVKTTDGVIMLPDGKYSDQDLKEIVKNGDKKRVSEV